jgi:[ribosomal protein S5]-alanine N-acetyltransferase
MFYIESERLRLIPLNLHQLRIYTNSEALAENLGLKEAKVETEPFFQSEFDDALQNHWAPLVEQNPDNYIWYTNWLIVLKEENIAVGGIGVTGLPDENGACETGYGMDLNHRGKGYATEALMCLAHWAFQNPDLKTIIAHTLIDGLSSQKVLRKAGFQSVKTEGELILWELKRSE